MQAYLRSYLDNNSLSYKNENRKINYYGNL